MKQPMLDIGNFFAYKLQRIVTDMVDTCERLDMSDDDIEMMVVSILATQLFQIVDSLGMDEETFVDFVTRGYRSVTYHQHPS